MSIHDDIDDTKSVLMFLAVGAAVYFGYKIYSNIAAGLDWLGNEISAGVNATGAAISSAATAEGQAQADSAQTLDPTTGETIQF